MWYRAQCATKRIFSNKRVATTATKIITIITTKQQQHQRQTVFIEFCHSLLRRLHCSHIFFFCILLCFIIRIGLVFYFFIFNIHAKKTICFVFVFHLAAILRQRILLFYLSFSSYFFLSIFFRSCFIKWRFM